VGEKPKGGRKPETTRVKKETQEEKESGNSQTQCYGVDQSTVQRRRPMHNTKTPKKKRIWTKTKPKRMKGVEKKADKRRKQREKM